MQTPRTIDAGSPPGAVFALETLQVGLGIPAGTEIWVQWAIEDTGAIQGVALSNAIMKVTP